MNYLADYQTFMTKKELNEATSAHLTEHKYQLNETDRDIFLTISRYAVKFPGAAHLKAATLANIVGKSAITVRRTINKLVGLRIIKKIPFIRKVKKGFGANLLIILPFCALNDKSGMISRPEAEKPVPVKAEAVKSEKEPFYYLNKEHLDTNTYSIEPKLLEGKFYAKFKSFIHQTIGEDQKLVSKLYGIYRANTVILTKFGAFNTQDIQHVGYEALRAAVMGLKHKKIHNLPGYFNGVLDKKLTQFIHMEAEAALELEEANV